MMRNKLALESLQHISAQAFDRKERTLLSNQLLHGMMLETSDITTMSKSLSLLIKLITIPSKSMNALTKLNWLEGEELLREGDTRSPILVSVARKLDRYELQIPFATLRVLKQFTQDILKYVLQPESNAQHH